MMKAEGRLFPARDRGRRLALRGAAGLAAACLLWIGGAEAAEVRARAVYPSRDTIPLVKLDPVLLACRRGPFRLEVPVTRLASVEVLGGRRLRLRFPGGETCAAKAPARPLSGEWSHGVFKEDWGRLRRVEILKRDTPKPEKGPLAAVKGPKGASVKGVRLPADGALEVRKGAFRFRVAWGRVRGLKRARPNGALAVSLADGRKLVGLPPKFFRGQWRGAALTIPWAQVAEVVLRGSPNTVVKTGGPPTRSSRPPPAGSKAWGAVLDDTGVRVALTAPPEFDGPFNLWDPVRQARDRALLPLARGEVTYLISVRAVKGVASSEGKGRLRVRVGSGKAYAGSPGDRLLKGRSPEGEFKIPLRRLKELAPSAPPSAGTAPPGIRAVVRLASGKTLRVRDPALFYERRLLPEWRETGVTWTGGHTKGFLFVRLGKTVQRVSFGKLARIEVPAGGKGKFTFVNRDGGRLSLRVAWDRHKAFEDMTGVEQWHKSAQAYALGHLGLLGWVEAGVRAHVPWSAIRSVEFQSPGRLGAKNKRLPRDKRLPRP
ncbi:MAG: hypothetical protein ACE5IM_01415 [Nitrospinota bacterium]